MLSRNMTRFAYLYEKNVGAVYLFNYP